MTQRILQFGTSRFLQAHVDLFVHEARKVGQDIGPITTVKTTPSGARDGRVEALNKAKGFPVWIRGFENGVTIDETINVESVAAAFDANVSWQKLIEIFVSRTEIVVSNVGDGGYEIVPQDRSRSTTTDMVPLGFPAKLLALLQHRFEQSAQPLLILPCELIADNGQVLRRLLNELSESWNLDLAFKNWLSTSVMICDTLVDRIVSEPIEPIGAIAEPYGLWAIKVLPNFIHPFEHPKVIYTANLEPFVRLKLHILNLGHSYLAEIWKTEQRPPQETVREILADADVKNRLMSLYHQEIVPGFSVFDMEMQASHYVSATVERFENPFLNHRISDIVQNHKTKIERRAGDFINWVKSKNTTIQMPRLEKLLGDQTRIID
jgi:tagaturonate reductase